jgi:hypothetical protein
MGFLDRAKQMAEQAQAKLDEAQKKFNESQRSDPVPEEPPGDKVHGDPADALGTPPTAPAKPSPPVQPTTPREDDAAPGLSKGDPLSG